jgi:hypothetical protein
MRMSARRVWIGLLLASAAFAQSRGEQFIRQEQVGFSHFEKQEWDSAIVAFEQQIAIYADNPRPYYNIACAYALQGQAERAAIWLKLSIDRGWRDARHLDGDGDWARVRESAAYQRIRAELDEVIERDPAPLPRVLPPESVPSSASVVAILANGFLDEESLELDPRLLDERQIRERLFASYDRSMARLTRYILENGDAPDADAAGRERVRIASLYRLRAADDSAADAQLREFADAYVRLTAEQFVERWPGSRHLSDVLLWRAAAEPPSVALPRFDAIERDFPDSPNAIRAAAEALLLRAHGDREELRLAFLAFDEGYGDTALGRELIESRLWRVRLLAKGIADLPAQLFEPALPAPARGHLLLAVVIAGDARSAELLARARQRSAELKNAPIGVVALPERLSDPQIEWLALHAKGLHLATDPVSIVRYLKLQDAPVLLEFRNGDLRN